MIKEFDTIAAIATATGGPIGIIRISGSETLDILNKLFIPARETPGFESHRLYYGHIVEDNDRILDEVLISFMKGPYSYTCEDIAEINCHGGIQSLQRILQAILNTGSARLAAPGEFTKRAFLNGRIDLAQAGAVIDVINAKTDLAQKAAVGRLGGKLSREVEKYREIILQLLAAIEASIDYPEHDMEEDNLAEILDKIDALIQDMEAMLDKASTGVILRDGIETVILGRPNVGKSSLLNALLGEERAIVTDIPGTTRDALQEYVNIAGVPLKIVDTAGIRFTEDIVEIKGVEKSRRYGLGADLVLLMVDGSAPLRVEDIEIGRSMKNKEAIVLVNKSDLPKRLDLQSYFNAIERKLPAVEISVKDGAGIDNLTEMLKDLFFKGIIEPDQEYLLGNIRDKDLMAQALRRLKTVLQGADQGVSEDLLAIDLNEAYGLLGEIIGETVGEDVIDKIFSEFCLGK